MDNINVAVLGAGSWGTALAKLLSDKGHGVVLWAHRPEHADALQTNRENVVYLPGFPFNERLRITSSIRTALCGARIVVMATPSHVYRQVFTEVAPWLEDKAIVVSATKGLEDETLLRMTGVMDDVLDGHASIRTAVLSGPSFARDIALGYPSAVTIAARDESVAVFLQRLFQTDFFRLYATTDVTGVELGGALKNIIAIAAGICDGLGYGANTRSALVTRGLAEIARLGVKMGANPLTFTGLAGMGDLMLTCTGDLSRNRQVGVKLGQRMALADILAEMRMVAEGVKTTRSALKLAEREGVDMPIVEQTYRVLYEGGSCDVAVRALLGREQKAELK